ncbi:MAG: 4'-phosphopantetheinyl transferase superfamily protein [Chitinophagaceae bacterium]|nr:4'-phosphopantetheinyl transferase superfamily protein [Chitinophagaceae bacterium]
MPVFFQHQINDTTRLGIWKIEETESFFKGNVPLHRDVTHPHKRLQHLAGRFLLQFLFPDFPYELVQIADTRKPFLANDQYHFSISHGGDYAAAIVSRDQRVGIDIEVIRPLVGQLVPKFLSENEAAQIGNESQLERSTLMWSTKECVFKWYGEGSVDFRKHIQLQKITPDTVEVFFTKTDQQLQVQYRQLDQLILAWVVG